MYFRVDLNAIPVYSKLMTIPNSSPENPRSNGQAETVAADYRDGLRILAHIISKKHLQIVHPKLNLKATEEEAVDRNENKKYCV
jgi:hypothetical protein